jgi:ElaB/YqjD/DUF883 family membrane-anchored ribosome-binding protein
MTPDDAVGRERIAQDMKAVISDAEELLRATATQAGDQIAAARERIQDSLYRAKVKLAELEGVVLDSTREVARATDDYVHDHPWRAVGIAAGVGLIVGLLIARR